VTMPDELRGRIARNLRPVRPLMTPWQRVLVALPAAALVFVSAPAVFGLRPDLANLGALLAWGGSLVQLGVGILLMKAALREAVPGDAMSGTSARLLLAAGIACPIVLGLLTNAASPEPAGRVESFHDWYFCWRGAVLAGLPLLLVLIVLLTRGLAMRPWLAGALAGMAAGAAVDGGWRIYCNYSNLSHVIPSHGGAVLTLSVAGAVLAVTLARLRQIFR
jgi:hypothetical protein